MTRAWLAGAVGLTALATWLLPPPGALPLAGRAATVAFAMVTATAFVALGAIALRSCRPSRQRRVGLVMTAAGVVLGAAAFLGSTRLQQACSAFRDGRTVLIGTQLTPLGLAYRQDHPDLPVDALLDDAAGKAELVWTKASIDRCGLLIAGTYFLWVPTLAVALLGAGSALARGRLGIPQDRPSHSPGVPPDARAQSATSASATSPRYDVFISYRHGDRDERFAVELLDALEAEGYAVAFDARDFPANESFLAEMERCIRQSRFTLALISQRYLQSGNCEEEAMICKVLDMSERRRRLIPLYLDDVDVPIWMHGIVGITLHDAAARLDPLDRLMGTLGAPLSRSR